MSTSGVYPPSEEFVRQAHVKGMEGYRELYRRAEQDPEAFWGDIAEREIHWFEKWKEVLDWQPPFAQWFVGAKTNVSYNCLDRHAASHRKNKVAILWEGEPGEQRSITYQELLRLVSRFANVLKARGYKTGDRSIIYMPMIPELPIAMLACARLGITHSVVFGVFSGEALKARIQDLGATVVITADGGYRRGSCRVQSDRPEAARLIHHFFQGDCRENRARPGFLGALSVCSIMLKSASHLTA